MTPDAAERWKARALVAEAENLRLRAYIVQIKKGNA